MRVVFFLLFVVSLPAIADAVSDPCQSAATPAINECAEIAYQKTDKALNSAYQTALKHLEEIDDAQQREATKKLLIEARRLYIAFNPGGVAAG
ncbi:MAG: DUF1311 domain-containing protein [Pseudomonadales bacterium]|jgi:uncharacterized protein YecT (DUF1311 family)|nr:DUF1311 domain-containing protein [Pseudomonadales bacterium]